MKKRQKIYTYTSDKSQDFSDVKVNPGKLEKDYVFVHTNIFYRFFACILYNIAIPILFVFEKFIHHTKVVNKQVINKLKDTGFFIYSNHTTISDGYQMQASVLIFKKKGYIVSLQDTFVTNRFFKTLLSMVGGIPIPSDLHNARNFLKCLKYRLEQKHVIIIFPEATIWPYYTGQRPSKPGSFKYPRTYDVPTIFSCTTFRKPKGLFKKFKKPRIVIYLSEPIYPIRSNTEKEDEARLRKLYEEFIELNTSRKDNYSANIYIEKDENNSSVNQNNEDLTDNSN